MKGGGGLALCEAKSPSRGKILDNTSIFLQSGAIWEQNRCYPVQRHVLRMNLNPERKRETKSRGHLYNYRSIREEPAMRIILD